MADFSAANFSASMALSKHRICSSSLSRNELSRDSTVDMTDAIACSELLSAAPASQRALCSDGSLSMSSWKRERPRAPRAGSSRSCTSLNTDTMCRRSSGCSSSGGRNSASSKIVEDSKPSAAS